MRANLCTLTFELKFQIGFRQFIWSVFDS